MEERQKSSRFKHRIALAFVLIISSSLFFLTYVSLSHFLAHPTVYSGTSGVRLPGIVSDVIGANSSVSRPEHSTHIYAAGNFSGSDERNFSEMQNIVADEEGRRQGRYNNFSFVGDTTTAPLPTDLGAGDPRGSEKVKETPVDVLTNKKWKKVIQEKEHGYNRCDVTKGVWVYDASYPFYTNTTCPIIDEGFSCQSNGRSDRDYMKWRWQPQGCNIPRFNATKMLELIRGKRLVFVGDSINRNQWESMLCMLMQALKDPKKVYETHGRRITKEKGIYSFRFVEHRCTVEYYASHYLVHEGKARIGQKRRPTLRIDAIDRGSSRWRGADILIFNTAHWWSHHKTKAGIYYYQEGNYVHPQLDVSAAFRRALKTWSTWVDKHVDRKKTRVFFRGSAPSHFRFWTSFHSLGAAFPH